MGHPDDDATDATSVEGGSADADAPPATPDPLPTWDSTNVNTATLSLDEHFHVPQIGLSLPYASTTAPNASLDLGPDGTPAFLGATRHQNPPVDQTTVDVNHAMHPINEAEEVGRGLPVPELNTVHVPASIAENFPIARFRGAPVSHIARRIPGPVTSG
jgi:hypothetical protein